MTARRFVLALIGLTLAALIFETPTAMAENRGSAHSQTRHQYCLGDRGTCYDACNEVDDAINGADPLMDPFFLGNCEQGCNNAMDSCEAAARIGGRLGELADGANAGILVEQTTSPLETVSEPKVKGACARVPGANFMSTAGDYGCVNPVCTKDGGVCTIVCVKGKCFASMPGKSLQGLTLVGILQGGNGVAKVPVETDNDSASDHDDDKGGGNDGGGDGPGIIY